jgi:hypothetical protein
MEKNSIGLNIADLQIKISNLSEYDTFNVDERFRMFYHDGESDVNLRVNYGNAPPVNLDQTQFDTHLNWRLLRTGQDWIIHTGSIDSEPWQFGVFSHEFRDGEIYVKREPKTGRFIFPLSYAIGEIFFINLLSRGLGIIVHSCGIAREGFGLIFAGKSGSGKSTLSQLWQSTRDVNILSDDRVIIRELDGRFWAYGTPWPGTGGKHSNLKVPLKSIFVISHSDQNQIKPISGSEAVAKLFSTCLAPLWDTAGIDFILQFLDKLTNTIQIYELGFYPDQRIIEEIQCLG